MQPQYQQQSQFNCQRIFCLQKSRSDVALDLLHRIANQVQPIMQERKWSVGTLSEFFPENKELLGININKGETIRIRLRSSTDESQFLPYVELVCTMLHELTHIVRSPHDSQFWDLYHSIRDRCEEHMNSGIVGHLRFNIGANGRSSVTTGNGVFSSKSGSSLSSSIQVPFFQGRGQVVGQHHSWIHPIERDRGPSSRSIASAAAAKARLHRLSVRPESKSISISPFQGPARQLDYAPLPDGVTSAQAAAIAAFRRATVVDEKRWRDTSDIDVPEHCTIVE